MFNVDQFHHCCAINIIWGFDEDYPQYMELSEKNKADIKASLKSQTKDHSYRGMILIAINSVQAEQGFKEIILECGYKLLHEPFFYPGHGNFIYLFGKENYPKSRVGRKPEMEVPVLVAEKETPVPNRVQLFKMPKRIVRRRRKVVRNVER